MFMLLSQFPFTFIQAQKEIFLPMTACNYSCADWENTYFFFISNSFFGLTLGLCGKFTFSSLKVALELLAISKNFNNF